MFPTPNEAGTTPSPCTLIICTHWVLRGLMSVFVTVPQAA